MGTGSNPQHLGKYELHELLGRGGMAEVWKAMDPHLYRYVAIKTLQANMQSDPEFVKRFLREARAVASLHHPNIVQIYDFQISRPPDSKSAIAYMVMDYVQGQTLTGYIAKTSRQGKMPPAEDLVHLFTSISLAVDYAHQQGMIHRDIKPANILLDQRNTIRHPMGEPILTDFGLVKLLYSPTSTLTGSVLGTPLYISPEQAQGYPGNEYSDIYSLGVILYELCTGKQPFSGGTPAAILSQHIHAMPTLPTLLNPAIPPPLAEVVMRCLAKDPMERFPNAFSMAAALAYAINESTLENMAPTLRLDKTGEVSNRHSAQLDVTTNPGTSPPSSVPAHVSLPPQKSMVSAKEGSLTKPAESIPIDDSARVPLVDPAQTPPLSPTPASKSRRRRWFIGLFAFLILILVSSSLGTFWFVQKPLSPQPSPVVGHAFFVSSGQLNGNGVPASNDELRINLQHVPDPAPGSSYYAWLMQDNNQPFSTPISLGPLSIEHGTAHLFFQGDSLHSDLLKSTSRILITEEETAIVPLNPSPDSNTRRYYAQLPQEPDPHDAIHHFSLLDHLRGLLAENPAARGVDVHSKLDFWLLINTGKVLEWASSARDGWDAQNTNLMRAHFIRILDYLDGESSVQADVPPGTQSVIISAPVALLGPDIPNVENQMSADYLHLISAHLNAIAQAPGVTSERHQLIMRINTAMNLVRHWLEKVRQDAKQLVSMTDAQLLSQNTLSLLDGMMTQAFYAYVGQLDPSTNEVQAGVIQINYDIERLATFDITGLKAG